MRPRLTPGNPMSLIQAAESNSEQAVLAGWFDQQWRVLPDATSTGLRAVAQLRERHAPATLYALILSQFLAGLRHRLSRRLSR